MTPDQKLVLDFFSATFGGEPGLFSPLPHSSLARRFGLEPGDGVFIASFDSDSFLIRPNGGFTPLAPEERNSP